MPLHDLHKPLLAAAVLAVVLISACVVFSLSDDSDAASAGQTNVYIYDGSQWSDHPGMPGYNALQALLATGEAIVADTDYVLYGDVLNPDYGNVTSIDGVAEDGSNVWNVFVYNNGWSVGIDAIGFITPFSDGAAPSANVVLYYGADTETVPSTVASHVTGYADLIDPVGNEDYAFEFYLKIDAAGYTPVIAPGSEVTYYDELMLMWSAKELSASDLANGITVKGYGSNAYAALKNAVGEGNIHDSDGSFQLFSLSAVPSGSNCIYWVQNGVDDGIVNYLSFNLGAYSTLDNVASEDGYDFTFSGFQVIYQEYIDFSNESQLDPSFGGLFGGVSGSGSLSSFTLSYNANGGSGAPSNQSWTGAGQSHSFTVSSMVPTWDGYDFTGWNTRADGSGTSYDAGDPITIPAGETVTLYAQWESSAPAERTMWLYYDLNGSTSPGFGNQSWTGTTDAVFRIDSSEPLLDGYEFLGWARASDASEAEW